MLTLKTDNLFAIGAKDNANGITSEEINSLAQKLPEYLQKIHARGQGFYTVIDDEQTLASIQEFAIKNKDRYENFVVLGIGGSALGTACIEQALGSLFPQTATQAGTPAQTLNIIDNIDPALIQELQDSLDLSKTLFIVITKSGSTPETLAQFFYFKNLCEKQGLPIKDHFVIITDPEKGFLRTLTTQESIKAFPIPPNVGGRFSVLTAVGLLPSAMRGYDTTSLLSGAKKMRDLFLNEDPQKNLPFQIAAMQYLLYQKGKTINVMTSYAQKLRRFADWYAQLLAESIGKNEQTGITPVSATGVTDQHSQLQLWNDGPNDKFHIFLSLKGDFLSSPPRADAPETPGNIGPTTLPTITIPKPYDSDPNLQFLQNLSFGKLLQTELEGTRQALTQRSRPNITIELDGLHAHTLGELFLLFEASIAILGEMFAIDAFNQPGVELSKKITRELLH